MFPSPGSAARPPLEPLQPPLEARPKLPRLLPGAASRRGPHMQGAARGARWSAATALGSARVRLQRAARRGAGRGGARRPGGGRRSGGKRGVQVRMATGGGGGRRARASRSVRASPRPAALDSPPRARSQDPSHLSSWPSAPERAKQHLWNEGRAGEKGEGEEGGQRRRGGGARGRERAGEGRGRGRGDSGWQAPIGGRAEPAWLAGGEERAPAAAEAEAQLGFPGRWKRLRDLPRPLWRGAAAQTCSGRRGGSARGFFLGACAAAAAGVGPPGKG